MVWESHHPADGSLARCLFIPCVLQSSGLTLSNHLPLAPRKGRVRLSTELWVPDRSVGLCDCSRRPGGGGASSHGLAGSGFRIIITLLSVSWTGPAHTFSFREPAAVGGPRGLPAVTLFLSGPADLASTVLTVRRCVSRSWRSGEKKHGLGPGGAGVSLGHRRDGTDKCDLWPVGS